MLNLPMPTGAEVYRRPRCAFNQAVGRPVDLQYSAERDTRRSIFASGGLTPSDCPPTERPDASPRPNVLATEDRTTRGTRPR